MSQGDGKVNVNVNDIDVNHDAYNDDDDDGRASFLDNELNDQLRLSDFPGPSCVDCVKGKRRQTHERT